MKRRKSPGYRSGSVAEQSCSSWLLCWLSALSLLLLLVVVMVGEVSGGAVHLMGSGALNVTNRASRCPATPLRTLQEVLRDHLRQNTSAHTAICEQSQLFDIVVGCGDYANETVKNWATGLCLASSWRGGVPQSRTRRRTSASLMADKQMKRINSMLTKARCKPRKMLLPVTEAAWLTRDQRKHFTERVYLEPCMIEVKRCGGCCANELLECSPTRSKNKTIPFLKLESSGREVRSSKINSAELIVDLTIEFHTKCECGCKTKRCTSSQVLDEENCTCRCPNYNSVRCPSHQYFDEEECGCRCHRRGSRECSSGMKFDESTCRCTR